jgi:hypothetical protein
MNAKFSKGFRKLDPETSVHIQIASWLCSFMSAAEKFRITEERPTYWGHR